MSLARKVLSCTVPLHFLPRSRGSFRARRGGVGPPLSCPPSAGNPPLALRRERKLVRMTCRRDFSYLSHRSQLDAGVDFVLRHHHGLRAEAFDDRAHEGADLRAGQQHRHFVLAGWLRRSGRARVWMNCCSCDGAMASWRSSPWPTIDSAKACSQAGDSAISGR